MHMLAHTTHSLTNLTYIFPLCFSCALHPENPKIRLPRQLRTKLITVVGEKVNLVIPFQVSQSLAAMFFFQVDMQNKNKA